MIGTLVSILVGELFRSRKGKSYRTTFREPARPRYQPPEARKAEIIASAESIANGAPFDYASLKDGNELRIFTEARAEAEARKIRVASNWVKIRSADISELTNPGLSEFHELLTHAQKERHRLLPKIQAAVEEAVGLERKQASWQQGRLLRRVFPVRYARIQESATQATARRDELHEQERLFRLQTQIGFPAQVREVYDQLLDAFAALKKCERKWDTVSRVAADQVRERTSAGCYINRKPVEFDLGSCDLIEFDRMVPHLANANGGDLYIYPGFVLMYSSVAAFALLHVAEVEIEASITPWIEPETVPADARIISQTWKKVNKDGSPDRRFAYNHQIPVVEYSTLRVTSESGLKKEYVLSNSGAVAQFVSAWKTFKQVVAGA